MRESLETQQVEELAHNLNLLKEEIEELLDQTSEGVKPVQLDQEAVGRVSEGAMASACGARSRSPIEGSRCVQSPRCV